MHVDVSDSRFYRRVLQSVEPVVAIFWRPKELIGTTLNTIYGANVKIVRIDAGQNPESVKRRDFSAFPAAAVFKDGECVVRFEKPVGSDVVESRVGEILAEVLN